MMESNYNQSLLWSDDKRVEMLWIPPHQSDFGTLSGYRGPQALPTMRDIQRGGIGKNPTRMKQFSLDMNPENAL